MTYEYRDMILPSTLSMHIRSTMFYANLESKNQSDYFSFEERSSLATTCSSSNSNGSSSLGLILLSFSLDHLVKIKLSQVKLEEKRGRWTSIAEKKTLAKVRKLNLAFFVSYFILSLSFLRVRSCFYYHRTSFFCRRGRPKTEGTGAKPLIFPPPWGLNSFRCPAPQYW